MVGLVGLLALRLELLIGLSLRDLFNMFGLIDNGPVDGFFGPSL